LAEHLDDAVPVMTLQNGIDAPVDVRHALPQNTVIASTCVVIVKKINSQTIELLGDEAIVNCGLFDGIGATRQWRQLLQNAFSDSLVQINLADDIKRMLWKKLALIASYGGVGAVSGLTVGQTRAHEQTRSMVRDAITECAMLARSLNVVFTNEDEEEVFSIYTNGFAEETTSSMQRDLANGLPSELEAQTGAIVKRAREKGLSLPIHEFIYRTQLPREREVWKAR
jgi:2-dehydropantoate 2-reductase